MADRRRTCARRLTQEAAYALSVRETEAVLNYTSSCARYGQKVYDVAKG